MTWQAFAPEILDNIIDLVIGGTSYEHFDGTVKRDVLNCALVCRAWLPVARHRLARFSRGIVAIEASSIDLYTLLDILESPLCTFQPCFPQEFWILSKGAIPPYPKDRSKSVDQEEPFLDKFFTLDSPSLLSLRKLTFGNTCPTVNDINQSLHNIKGGGEVDPSKLPSNAIFSQIEHLEIYGHGDLMDVIHLIRHCPSIKSFTGFEFGYKPPPPKICPSLRPPKTLCKLYLNQNALTSMSEWLMSCTPPHIEITSVSIKPSSRPMCIDPKFSRFFNAIGSNLEELKLIEPSKTPGGQLDVFLQNSSLKRIVIVGDLDTVDSFLPYLFCQSNFAPTLETLEIHIYTKSISKLLGSLPEILKPLLKFDDLLHFRTSIQEVLVDPTQDPWDSVYHLPHGVWVAFEREISKHLPETRRLGKLRFSNVS